MTFPGPLTDERWGGRPTLLSRVLRHEGLKRRPCCFWWSETLAMAFEVGGPQMPRFPEDLTRTICMRKNIYCALVSCHHGTSCLISRALTPNSCFLWELPQVLSMHTLTLSWNRFRCYCRTQWGETQESRFIIWHHLTLIGIKVRKSTIWLYFRNHLESFKTTCGCGCFQKFLPHWCWIQPRPQEFCNSLRI